MVATVTSLPAAAQPPEITVFERDLTVRVNETVNDEYKRMVLAAPADLLRRCRPGQFFHLLCPGVDGEMPFLRRPMSIYGAWPERGELHFLYKVTGAGTRGLASLAPGDDLSVVGPLGRGFRIEDDWNRLMLVARGVGMATLAPLALAARERGKRLVAVLSARDPEHLMSAGMFADLGAEVVTVTDSEGTSGMDHLRALIEARIAAGGVDAFYTCGSNRILTLLQQLGARHRIPGEVALEQQMACGLGMCHCCVRPFLKDGERVNLRVCREGPVFDLEEAIAW